MPLPPITLYTESDLDRARGRAYHLRAAAAEMTELAERMETQAKALDADELFDLAAQLRDSAADNEAHALNLDEAIGAYQERRRA